MSASLGPRRVLASPNLRVFYVWTFLSKLSVLTPFFALFLAHRLGVVTAEITFLFATYSATRFLSEVPLGALSDRVGERPTLRLSSVLALAGVACLVFGPLPALFLGQALFALSESASSGVQEALLYRLCDEDKVRGIPYRQAQSAFISIAWIGVACAGALGALVSRLSLNFLGDVAVAIPALTCLLTLRLPKASGQSEGTEALRIRRLCEALINGADFRFWFFLGASVGFVLTVAYFTIQPLLNEINLAGPDNGLLYSAVTIFAAYGAHLTTRLNNIFATWRAAFVAALVLVILAILGLRLSASPTAIFAAMAVLRFAWGWIGTTCTTALNETVPMDGLRATILSTQSLATGLLSAAALALFAGLGLSAETILLLLAAAVTVSAGMSFAFFV